MDVGIFVFGDSTAWGAWDLEKGGWVNRFWLHLAEKEKDRQTFTLYNLSVSGGTTETILERFERESKIREAGEGDIFIFQTGGNDAAYERAESNFLVPPEKFKANLEKIIEKTKKISDSIIFIGQDLVDESKTKPVVWADIYYTNGNIKKYNEIMREVCKTRGVLFLDIYDPLNNEDLFDGLHQNSAGHEKIFQKVKDFLMQNKLL